MGRKIKEMLTHNLSLKILACVFSIILWWAVVSINNPTQTKRFAVPVSITNEEVLTQEGKYYTVLNNSNTISIRVTAKRSVIERLSSADFTATADLARLENNSQIPVDIRVNRYSNQVSFSANTYYVYVRVEEKKSASFTVDISTKGSVADGYALGEVTSDPKTITVAGPEDVMKTVKSVQVVLDVDGLVRDTTRAVVPRILDKNGKAVDTTSLTLSSPSVEVTARVQSVKSVPVTVETSGTLKEGLKLLDVSADPKTVDIMGDASVINEVSAITIPGSAVNLSAVTETTNIPVDITTYLPDGVTLVDPTQAKVSVSVTLEGQDTKVFDVPTANLTIRNLGENLEADFGDTSVAVQITGMESALETLDPSTVTGTIDASGLGAGTHTVSVTVNPGEGFTAAAAQTKLTLKKTDEASD